MGQHNRRRRAAKQRDRQPAQAPQPGRRFTPPAGGPEADPPRFDFAGHALDRLVHAVAGGSVGGRLRDAFTAFPPGEQQAAVDAALDVRVRALVAVGWCPLDLAEIARRRASDPAEAGLVAVLRAQTAEHPQARVHPRWSTQLEQLRALPTSRCPAWPESVGPLIILLAVLSRLPTVHRVLPPPGSAPAPARSSTTVDVAVLRKVRGLLAKAESTEFEAEAEALSAKAQSLMRQHSIDRAMAEAEDSATPETAARRLWLDNPYLVPKATLVAEVADANRCRSVFSDGLGFVTVLGFDADLDTVELLATSLMVQAQRGMRLAGSQTPGGVTRTRSFRQSFLLAYAARIGERLRASSESAERDSDTQHGGSLLPVLAARDRVVQDAFDAAFPHLVDKRVRIGNAAGWGAGRAAADLAQLDVHRPLQSRAG